MRCLVKDELKKSQMHSAPVATVMSLLVVLLVGAGLSGCSGCSPTQDQPADTKSSVDELRTTITPSSIRQPNLFEKKNKPYPKTLDPFAKPDPPGEWVTTPSGLKYQDIVKGFGMSPTPNFSVMVHYTGYLSDGTQFERSLDKGMPFKFTAGTGMVIKGFDEAIKTMKVGGKRRVVIPPHLGYGNEPHGKIQPGETLTYEIQLLSCDR
jgi:peptidylprolyl isomerase